jgi:DNA-binding NtrC family response regulator
MQPEALTNSGRLRGTILIVDDDERVRRVMTRWIDQMGHQVKAAADAEEAIHVMRGGVVDVALCDMRMPGRDGIWLVGQLRRSYPYTSIVLATGIAEMDPMVTLRPGVVGYIVKPFSREALENVIQRGLEACSDRRASGSIPRQRALPPAASGTQSSIVDATILARF